MGITVEREVYILLVSFAAGALNGFVFDFFRGFRRKVKSKNSFVAVQDILFWIICAALTFAFVYRFNNGQPRWYIFCGIILGMLIYSLTISRLVVFLVAKLLELLAAALKLLIKILLFPVKLIIKPFKILIIPLCKLTKKLRAFLSRMKNNLKKTKKRLKMY